MTPIHEMKTRKDRWRGVDANGIEHKAHGVFFEVNGREVGVVIRDQPEEVARPLIEAFAALPEIAKALLEQGYGEASGWHTQVCHEYARSECTADCKAARGALKTLGCLP